MRQSRTNILNDESGIVHTYWRCHNKENYFSLREPKALYMDCLTETLNLKQSSYFKKIKLHSFCVMKNHFHKLITYENGSHHLSNLLRRCNGKFGLIYNMKNNRSGKVAESRPKTALVENATHAMQVHMYIEANPLFVKKTSKTRLICRLKTLHHNKFCSYGFYAYGIETEFTKNLTIPEWYLELGSSNIERQIKYRKIFLDYILNSIQTDTHKINYFIGSTLWILEKKIQCQIIKTKSLEPPS